MRLSYLPVFFFAEIIDGRMPVAERARMGSALGLDTIDLSILFIQPLTEQRVEILRREIEDAGSRVAMLTTYPDFAHPDALQRRRQLDQAIETVHIGQALGASLVRVTAGQVYPATGRAEGVASAIEGLSRLVEAVLRGHADSALPSLPFPPPPTLPGFTTTIRACGDWAIRVSHQMELWETGASSSR